MTDRKGKDIVLRCSLENRLGEWIWADILPENWSLTVEQNPTEVGVFLVEKEALVSAKQPVDTFLRGGLYFTYWIDDDRSTMTNWATLDLKPNLNNWLPTSYIDRPENYTVGIDA